MKRFLILLLALGLLLIALSLAAGEWLTRPARQTVGAAPAGLNAQVLRLPFGSGEQVAGWFLPGRPGAGAVLLLHGVRGNRLQMLARARWLQAEGIACLLIDLPAHGESSGERISFGRRESIGAAAALNWLRQRLPQERLGAIGVSLGGAALLFAKDRPTLSALVLESVYPTIEDAVIDRLQMRLGAAGRLLAPALLQQLPLRLNLALEDLRPIDAVAQIGAPALIAAGTEDQHTRWPETEALFAAAQEPKQLWAVPGAGHVDLHDFDPGAYRARVLPFLREQLSRP